MVTVLLALAVGPGFPQGSADHRYEIELALDAAGHPDAAAWLAEPEPWRARRTIPGAVPLQGDVQFDADHGWSIRFFGSAADGPDAPEARFDCGTEPMRPGAYVTVTEPDGAEFAYRVVGVA